MDDRKRRMVADLALAALTVAGAILLLVGAMDLPPPRFEPLGSAAAEIIEDVQDSQGQSLQGWHRAQSLLNRVAQRSDPAALSHRLTSLVGHLSSVNAESPPAVLGLTWPAH